MIAGKCNIRSRTLAPENEYVKPFGIETPLTIESPIRIYSGGGGVKKLMIVSFGREASWFSRSAWLVHSASTAAGQSRQTTDVARGLLASVRLAELAEATGLSSLVSFGM